MVKDIRQMEEILGTYPKKPLNEEISKKKNIEKGIASLQKI